MKITKLLEFETAYASLLNKSLPMQLSYELVNIHRKAEKDVEFYQTQMTNIIDQYAERDENGQVKPMDDKGFIPIQQDKLQECQAKIDELSQLELSEYEGMLSNLNQFNLDDNILTLKDIEILMNFQ